MAALPMFIRTTPLLRTYAMHGARSRRTPQKWKESFASAYPEEPFDNKKVTQQLAPAKWNEKTKRTGAVGFKLGMMTHYDEWGKRIPVTVIHVSERLSASINNPSS